MRRILVLVAIGSEGRHRCAPDAVEYDPATQKVHTESFTAPAASVTLAFRQATSSKLWTE